MMNESYLTPEQIRLPPSPARSPPLVVLTNSVKENPAGDRIRPSPPLITTSLVSPRTRSPMSWTHTRSRSLASSFPVPMTRAHSSPGIDSRGRYIYPPSVGRPASPMEQSMRRHSPLRTTEDLRTLNIGSLNISETISENDELELPHTTLSVETEVHPTSAPLPPLVHNNFSRPFRRPSSSSSSLHSNISNTTSNNAGSPASVHSSPLMVATKFNEPYPGLTPSSASSMPSTPTSLRSRSPSISSLETIPDIPDAEAYAEAEAIEADESARLKLAADGTDSDSMRRRSNLENSPTMTTRGYGTRADKRKRWSVCGAERRQDLDLETIWED